MKILIVEDNVWLAEELNAWLSDEGYTVLGIADSGKKALEMVEKDVPDLMIVDIGLKGRMNGISLMKNVLNQHDVGHIYLSGNIKENLDWLKQTNPQVIVDKLPDMSKKVFLNQVDFALHKFNEEKLADQDSYVVDDSLFIFDSKTNKDIRIPLKDICWFEAAGPRTIIKTKKEGDVSFEKMGDNLFKQSKKGCIEKEHIICLNLNGILKKLSLPNIKRVNRRYAVNLDNVTAYLRGDKTLEVCGIPLKSPLGNYCPNIWKHFNLLCANRKKNN